MLLTSGITSVMNANPFEGPMISLPLQVFDFVRSPEPTMIARGFGTAAVLILLVLGLFVVARIIGGRGPGILSDRQRRAAQAESMRDLQRITVLEDRVAMGQYPTRAPLAAAPPAHPTPEDDSA